MSAAPSLNPNDAPSWSDFVTNFDTSYQQFMDNYNALLSLGPYVQSKHPELKPQYDALVNAGADNYNKLIQLKATRDYAASWLNWLSTGAQGFFDYAKSLVGLSGYERSAGLGIAPIIVLVGLGAATASIIVIARWITNAYTFAQRLNALQDAEARGATPAQAAQIVSQVLGSPPTQDFLGIPWSLLIWGGIAIFLGPQLLKMLDRKGQ